MLDNTTPQKRVVHIWTYFIGGRVFRALFIDADRHRNPADDVRMRVPDAPRCILGDVERAERDAKDVFERIVETTLRVLDRIGMLVNRPCDIRMSQLFDMINF